MNDFNLWILSPSITRLPNFSFNIQQSCHAARVIGCKANVASLPGPDGVYYERIPASTLIKFSLCVNSSSGRFYVTLQQGRENNLGFWKLRLFNTRLSEGSWMKCFGEISEARRNSTLMHHRKYRRKQSQSPRWYPEIPHSLDQCSKRLRCSHLPEHNTGGSRVFKLGQTHFFMLHTNLINLNC